MQAHAARVLEERQAATGANPAEKHWDLAFLGILLYLVIEYSRLPAMYPTLQALSLGKVAVGIAALGYISVPRARLGSSGSRGIDFTIFLFVLVGLVSSCLARYQDLAWTAFFEIVRWALIYFLISRILTNSWRIQIFIFLLLLLNAKLGQFVVRTYFSELASGLPGMYLAKQGVGAMAGGFFSNGEDLGLAMVVVWPIAGCILLAQKKIRNLLVMLAIFVVILLAILFCGSRGALVGACMVALAAWVRKPKITTAGLLILVLVPAIVYVLPEASKERLRSAENWENDKTASHRVLLWKAGLRMFPDYPIFGVGPENFGPVRKADYSQDDSRPTNTAAHNTFVQALAELGLLGEAGFLSLLLLFFRLNSLTRRILQRRVPHSMQSFDYCLVMGLDLAMVGFMTSGFFHNSLYYPHLWILLGISAGLHQTCVQKQLVGTTSDSQDRVKNLPWRRSEEVSAC